MIGVISHGQTAKWGYGRVEVEITKVKRSKNISARVETKSPFPGGDSAWVAAFENRLNQSTRISKRLKKGKYVVTVYFIVMKDSILSDIRCENDPGFGVCAEVTRLLKGPLGGKWKPAPQPVRERRTSYIFFKND